MKIFLSGIGGIGMSAYAGHMNARGHDVTGSDREDSALLDDLRQQGIDISLTQDGSAIPDDCDLFVYSEAIPETSAERLKAQEKKIPSLSYFEALGKLSKDTSLIAVCGTHGKSSTTAMIGKMLIDTKRDPSIVVGTLMRELQGRNWKSGKGEWVVEACEYRSSFLHLSPKIIVVTNIDYDHHDAFASKQEYDSAFAKFFAKLPSDGVIMYHGSDGSSTKLIAGLSQKKIDADAFPMIDLSVPGDHMKHNAQLVLALADHLSIDSDAAQESLKQFSGTWRRFEKKIETDDGIVVIDDYGHHPKEIEATLAAAKELYPTKRIVCVFQPHTHDRTLSLWKEFGPAFHNADTIILSSVYDARSQIETELIDEEQWRAWIETQSQRPVLHGGDLENTFGLLKKELQPNDCVVVMGAGSITNIAAKLTASLA